MANIEQIGFQPNSNQKVIVEELIESELERIVGGDSSQVSSQSSQVSVQTTDGTSSIVQTTSQGSVKNPGRKPFKPLPNDLVKILLNLGIDISV